MNRNSNSEILVVEEIESPFEKVWVASRGSRSTKAVSLVGPSENTEPMEGSTWEPGRSRCLTDIMEPGLFIIHSHLGTLINLDPLLFLLSEKCEIEYVGYLVCLGSQHDAEEWPASHAVAPTRRQILKDGQRLQIPWCDGYIMPGTPSPRIGMLSVTLLWPKPHSLNGAGLAAWQ